MNTKQEHIYYWCRGSKENPEGVIKALEEKGVANPTKFTGDEDTRIYYADLDNEVDCCIIGTEYADLIMRCGVELKPVEKPKRWRDDEDAELKGYFIDNDSRVKSSDGRRNAPHNHKLFATKKQAKAALAMARISQIMANDKRFGGVVTDEEWKNDELGDKFEIYVITRVFNKIRIDTDVFYNFLAFHTEEQRDLFLEENRDLVKDFLMIE